MHSKGLPVKLIGLAFAAIALPFITNEWFGEWFHTSNVVYLRVFHPEYWFRKFAPGRPTQQQIDDIRIVTIEKGTEPGSALGENRCTHRRFMANLLNKLATFHPNLVVIDKWYNKIPAGVCPPAKDGEKDSTEELKEAVWNVANTSKIVIAVESYTHEEAEQVCNPVQVHALQLDQVVLSDYQDLLEFSPCDRKNASVPKDQIDGKRHPYWGLARLNIDVRKIPLGWMAFEKCNNVGLDEPIMIPTLATAAASLINEDVMKSHNLGTLKEKVTHPYTKLVLEDEADGGFKSISAIGVLCNQANEDVDWQKCGPNEGTVNRQALEGKTIIIGESRKDFFQADGVQIAGPALQANYIAALLSNNPLRPVNPWVNRAIGLVWLGLIFWFYYWRFKRSPELAAVVSAVATFGFGVFFSAVITRQFGFFADVVPPTVLEIIGLYLARKIEQVLDKYKESTMETGKVGL